MALTESRRKTPEEYLQEAQAEEARAKGHLKIMLGYASGVGKSFRMLDEARRRKERGQDIVVGAVQPQVPPDAEAILKKLEVIPLKTVDSGTALDVEAILWRRPWFASSTAWLTIIPPARRIRRAGGMSRISSGQASKWWLPSI